MKKTPFQFESVGRRLLWLMVSVVTTQSIALGDLIVSNLGEATSSILQIFPPPGGDTVASSFTVDANNYTLDRVTLNMSGGSSGSGFTVQIRDDSGAGGDPGTILGTLTGSVNPFAAGTYDYTGALSLTANSTYWVTASVAGGGSGEFRWFTTTSLSETGVGTIGDSVEVAVAGAATFDQTFANRSFMFSVDASPVPEPDFAVLVIFAIAGLGLSRRR